MIRHAGVTISDSPRSLEFPGRNRTKPQTKERATFAEKQRRMNEP